MHVHRFYLTKFCWFLFHIENFVEIHFISSFSVQQSAKIILEIPLKQTSCVSTIFNTHMVFISRFSLFIIGFGSPKKLGFNRIPKISLLINDECEQVLIRRAIEYRIFSLYEWVGGFIHCFKFNFSWTWLFLLRLIIYFWWL